MTRIVIIATTLLIASSALAQTSPVSPPVTSPTQSPNQGSPNVANSGPGATGTTSREGTGAGTVSNNSAASSNAAQPERAVPNTGSNK